MTRITADQVSGANLSLAYNHLNRPYCHTDIQPFSSNATSGINKVKNADI